MKPKHQGGYTTGHTRLCERTLVTLSRGLGPWKEGLYVTGGLVPRYLIPVLPAAPEPPPHIGTTDVDLVLDFAVLAEVEAYRRLEQNLKTLGFVRGQNDAGAPQHFSWRKPVGEGITIVVDLLCDAVDEGGGRVRTVTGEKRLSALGIPGAYLVTEDYINVELTEELLDERGIATETVRVANIVPFLALKALAYDDRLEEKDAYDMVYCLTHYSTGPEGIAEAYAASLTRLPGDPFLRRALEVWRRRFASDDTTEGYRKDGPVSYARFLADPGRTGLNVVNQRNAAAVVALFLNAVNAKLAGPSAAKSPADNPSDGT